MNSSFKAGDWIYYEGHMLHSFIGLLNHLYFPKPLDIKDEKEGLQALKRKANNVVS